MKKFTMNGAQFLAQTFKKKGLTHVFFVEAILREALVEMEALGIKRIVAHSEKAAAYMADGYARAGRKVGVCMAQSVGGANLASGLQDAFLSHSPVLALTGRQEFIAHHRNAYQEALHGPMYRSVTKFRAEVNTIEQFPYLLRQAYREAVTGSPGPVHLDLMGIRGHILERQEAVLEPIGEERFARYPAFRPFPEPKDIHAAALLLKDSKRPVIVAGGGAAISNAGPEILCLAEKGSIPVALSVNGKGLVPSLHPLCVGVVGTYSQWCANKVVTEADLVVFIGSHTGDQTTNVWSIPKAGTPVIQIDIDPTELGRSYPNSASILGDAKVAVGQLSESISKRAPGEWQLWAAQQIKDWRNEHEPHRGSGAVPIRPERVCRELSEWLPADAILVSDTGNSAIWTATMIDLDGKDQRYIRAGGGSLGWAFPASLGVKCAEPNRPVICFTGDAGFMYHISELETASRWGINSVVVVNNNGGFGQCRPNVLKAYGDRQGAREDLFRFQNTNFSEIAAEFGCLGIRVESPDRIRPALCEALAANRPAIVEVITGLDCSPQSPWTPPRNC
jgi:acetolactate synthase I/II/III large subunit